MTRHKPERIYDMANYQKGDEFVIKITDVMTGEDGKTVYRMNDFNSLVFDQKGLERLKKVKDTKPVPAKISPFRRTAEGAYWYIDEHGNVVSDWDQGTLPDQLAYDVANYSTDEAMMKQRALHETLNRLLWRYSEEHGGDCRWDCINKHWLIIFDHLLNDFRIVCATAHQEAVSIFFRSKEIAEDALRDIVRPFLAEHPDFVW